MADELGLTAVLALDITPFQYGITQALNAAVKFSADFASSIKDGVEDSLKRVSEQFKNSGNFDITIGCFQKLQFAADQTGTSLTTMLVAARRLESNLGKATFGNSTAQDIFTKLGVSAKELANLPLDQQLLM